MAISFVKLAPFVALAILAAGVGGFFYGKNIGKELAESKQKDVIIEGVESREEIEHINKGLDHNTIVERLNGGGWLRND